MLNFSFKSSTLYINFTINLNYLFPFVIIFAEVMILNITTAIFDMDGTLVDSLMLWDIFWSSFGKDYLGNADFRPSDEHDKMVRTLTLKDAMHLIHKEYGIADSGDQLHQQASNILYDF